MSAEFPLCVRQNGPLRKIPPKVQKFALHRALTVASVYAPMARLVEAPAAPTNPTERCAPTTLEARGRSDGREWPYQPSLSFDHFVGPRENRRRQGEAQRLGCLVVDHEVELGRLLDRKIRWFCAMQDLADQPGGLPE